MSFEMSGIDHQLIGLATTSSQGGKDPVEDAKSAPANETVVECLVWPVVDRCITPTQSVSDNENDPAKNAPVINPGHAMGTRKKRF